MTLYKRKDLEKLLKISKTKATQLLKSGKISSFKYGNEYRVTQDQLDEYLHSINSDFLSSPSQTDEGIVKLLTEKSTLKIEESDKTHNVLPSKTSEVKTDMSTNRKKQYKKQGNPFKRTGKHGTTWTVRYYEIVDGKKEKRYKGGFKTKAEAEVFKSEVSVLVHSGRYISPSTTTVADFLTKWFENNYLCFEELSDDARQFSPNTIQQYDNSIQNHLIPLIGTFKLQDLCKEDINKMNLDLFSKKKYSANTVRIANSILKKAFEDAVDNKLISANPCSKAWKPPVKHRKFRVLSVNEQILLKDLLSFKQGTSFLPILVMLETGMRRGEALGIMYSDCNFEKNTIVIRRQVARVSNKSVGAEKPKELYGLTEYLKTSSSYRTIDVSSELMDILKSQKDNIASLYTEDKNDLIFRRKDGNHLLPNSVYREFKKLLKKNNLPDIRLHDLRGTFITTMHRAGVPLIDIARYVGHEDISTTAMYLHDTGEEKPICSQVIRKQLYGESAINI